MTQADDANKINEVALAAMRTSLDAVMVDSAEVIDILANMKTSSYLTNLDLKIEKLPVTITITAQPFPPLDYHLQGKQKESPNNYFERLSSELGLRFENPWNFDFSRPLTDDPRLQSQGVMVPHSTIISQTYGATIYVAKFGFYPETVYGIPQEIRRIPRSIEIEVLIHQEDVVRDL